MSRWSELAGNREMLAKGKWQSRFAASHSRKGIRESTNRRVVQRGKGSPKSVALFVLVRFGRGGSAPITADVVPGSRREMLALTTLGDAVRRL